MQPILFVYVCVLKNKQNEQRIEVYIHMYHRFPNKKKHALRWRDTSILTFLCTDKESLQSEARKHF